MKICYRSILVSLVCLMLLSFSAGFAAGEKEYPTSPPETITQKWRIGYLEGGAYKNYQSSLIATVEAFSALGWIEPITVSPQKDNDNTSKLWVWLTANVKSDYLQFVGDAYYSNNWDEAQRRKNKIRLLKRLNEDRDIDLMIAMGTWAGQDLANNDHTVPTVVCSVTDALGAGITKSIEDSGYDHIHVRVDPTRYARQIRAFHDVIEFEKLGVAFEDSTIGRSYAAIEDIETIAKERNFEVIECHVREHGVSTEETESDMISCARELAPKIDAFYFPASIGVTSDSLPHILAALNVYKIPTFSMSGVDQVRRGVLLSVALAKFEGAGKFYAETIAKIVHGAKPRGVNQIYEESVKIAFNAAAAMIIGLDPQTYNLLMGTAEEVYEEIETGE